jgi:hypothetical protein
MMESIIAQAITSFLVNTFTKGGEELGKNVSGDIYNKAKKLFSEDHRPLLANLKEEPQSPIRQEEFGSEISGMLKQSNSLSKEFSYILTAMDANMAFLEAWFNAYKELEYDYGRATYRWTRATPETEKACLEEIHRIESKMLTLTKRISQLLQKQ